MAAVGAHRKRETLLMDFCSPLENGRSHYGDLTAKVAPKPVVGRGGRNG